MSQLKKMGLATRLASAWHLPPMKFHAGMVAASAFDLCMQKDRSCMTRNQPWSCSLAARRASQHAPNMRTCRTCSDASSRVQCSTSAARLAREALSRRPKCRNPMGLRPRSSAACLRTYHAKHWHHQNLSSTVSQVPNCQVQHGRFIY